MTIVEVIEQETEQKVTAETPLEELALDSLEFLQMLLAIKEETGKSVPDDRMGMLATVGDIEREAA